MLRSAGIGRDEREVNLCLLDSGQLGLGLLCGLLQALQGHLVLSQVYSLFSLVFVAYPVHYPLVEIVTTKVGITVGCLNLKGALAQFQDGYIEGATADVVDGNSLLFFLFHAVG